ncbi:DUF5658 family protein (plasmid) [Burkholderia multivorans]|uniref:DUF5658 domain-containing protein n=2 Tax=Burkholderia multivorans TaxID=87883 RepID=A0A0H3KS02_BURM1|nr:DUF5658 family protein [Burkholderia multivorans]ELK7722781.1 hypothetical protein [Burkholderia cenocepacia]ABX19890.1 hypothetical protein Bmul_6237 [Burkholderia multivorans ATCC 17616]MBR8048081.1 hypothetical protein [Burkholderia multivorans]MBR8453214.1 hypothetical protein [Burkholderia multivorans]MBU9450145.1 hypothetical protein [Burkholderia multivorans]
MRIDHCKSVLSRYRTPSLLGVVAALQILDWHSTLTAPHTRGETNRLINWLVQWVSFESAVSTFKLLCLAMLLYGFLFWRKHKGLYETEFALALGVVAVVYGGVVFNNYVA